MKNYIIPIPLVYGCGIRNKLENDRVAWRGYQCSCNRDTLAIVRYFSCPMQATDGCISSLSSSWRSNFDEVFIRDVLGFQINSYGSTNDVNLEGFPTIFENELVSSDV